MWVLPQLKKKKERKKGIYKELLKLKSCFAPQIKMPVGTGKWQDMTMPTVAGFTMNELTIKV